MSFLVDTDVCSAYLKETPGVFTRFVQYSGQLHLSTICLGELYAWALRKSASPGRMQGLLDLRSNMTVLGVDEMVAYRFGELRAQLIEQGRGASPADLFIAATALVHSLAVVTHNVQDFAVVPGLQVVDWLAP